MSEPHAAPFDPTQTAAVALADASAYAGLHDKQQDHKAAADRAKLQANLHPLGLDIRDIDPSNIAMLLQVIAAKGSLANDPKMVQGLAQGIFREKGALADAVSYTPEEEKARAAEPSNAEKATVQTREKDEENLKREIVQEERVAMMTRTTKLEHLLNVCKQTWHKIEHAVEHAWNRMTDGFGQFAHAMGEHWDSFTHKMHGMKDSIAQTFSEVKDTVVAKSREMWEGTKELAASAIDKVKGLFGMDEEKPLAPAMAGHPAPAPHPHHAPAVSEHARHSALQIGSQLVAQMQIGPATDMAGRDPSVQHAGPGKMRNQGAALNFG